MPRFIGELKLRALRPDEDRQRSSDAQLWELMEPFAFECESGLRIDVPPGFVSDFASVPRLARWYIDDDDPCILRGAVIHDFIYCRQGHVDGGICSRAFADYVLREAMLCSGARPAMAWVVEKAVRLGGASHWKN
jgi:hypothetical protein